MSEAFNSVLKVEYVHRRAFRTRAEARLKIATWITDFYNARRLHSVCGFKSPIDCERDYRAPEGTTPPERPASSTTGNSGRGSTASMSAKSACSRTNTPASEERLVLVRASTIETVPQDEVTVSTYRSADLGPINIGEVVINGEFRLECDDIGTGFYVQLPITGRFESRHRGVDMMINRLSSALYRPDGGAFTARWPAGYHALCVRIDRPAVETVMARLIGERAASRVVFDPVMNIADGFGRNWAQLLLSVNRQLTAPDSLLSQPLVAAPLADSIVNGFFMAATHSQTEALTAPVAAVRPASVRTAVDIIESDPQAPLTLSLLADRCDVGPRTLQKAFQLHLGMSPMEYLRDVRLRRAHEELRAADPSTCSVAVVARRWGFAHLGRFAAAHEAKFGQKPLRTLRG